MLLSARAAGRISHSTARCGHGGSFCLGHHTAVADRTCAHSPGACLAVRVLCCADSPHSVPLASPGYAVTVCVLWSTVPLQWHAVRTLLHSPCNQLRPPRPSAAPCWLTQVPLCSAITHPHIVQPKSLIRTHSCLCVLADHANGGDVFQMVLRDGRGLAPAAARFLFQQLVLTVMFSHLFAMFLVDIKPSRLLVFWNQHGMPILKIRFISLSLEHLQRTAHEVCCPSPPPFSPPPLQHGCCRAQLPVRAGAARAAVAAGGHDAHVPAAPAGGGARPRA